MRAMVSLEVYGEMRSSVCTCCTAQKKAGGNAEQEVNHLYSPCRCGSVRKQWRENVDKRERVLFSASPWVLEHGCNSCLMCANSTADKSVHSPCAGWKEPTQQLCQRYSSGKRVACSRFLPFTMKTFVLTNQDQYIRMEKQGQQKLGKL